MARYCSLLTVQAACSRYLLACERLVGPLLQPTQRVLQRLLRNYGLRERVRSEPRLRPITYPEHLRSAASPPTAVFAGTSDG
jgi:hypothetical protein